MNGSFNSLGGKCPHTAQVHFLMNPNPNPRLHVHFPCYVQVLQQRPTVARQL